MLLFARTPVDGSFVVDVLPASLLIGLGAGVAFNPLLLAAMSGVGPSEAGLASGIVNTSFMMGGALGLAVLASIATARTDSFAGAGEATLDALLSGYHAAFLVGGVFVAVSAVIAGLLLRSQPAGHGAGEPSGGDPALAGASDPSA